MDTAIKQRILGGVVLLAGAAMFLPLMLDGTGAKLLSRLDPIPVQPVIPGPGKAAPDTEAQSRSAEQAVDEAHEDATEFYPVGEQVTAGTIPATEPPVSLAKTPEQLAAEEAARKRAQDLLSSPDEISPEEAAQQQRAADKLARDMAAHAEAPATLPVPGDAARKAEEERARAILEAREARTAADQKAAEDKARLDRQRADAEALKARDAKSAQDKLAADKSRAEQDRKQADDKARADKERLAAEKKQADDKLKADKKLTEEKAKLEADAKAKADKLAAEKKAAEEKARKQEEQKKAQAALEGKAKADSGSQAWIVQAGSFSGKDKAAELAGKLKGKGYRAQVVKSGEAWKVVVGPEIDKDAAKALSGRLNNDGVSGAWVAPWKP